MAQTDWLILSSSNNIVGGGDGTATLHASMSNPITSSGAFCRTLQSNDENRCYSVFVPTSLTSSVSGFSLNKAYSLRCWARVTFDSDNSVALRFKSTTDLDFSFSNENSYKGNDGTSKTGYVAYLTYNSLKFTAQNDRSDASNIVNETAVGSLTTDTWYRIRMDVIPYSSSYDVINIYTGSENDTWGLVYTKSIANSSINAYVPWNTGSRGGIGLTAYSRSSARPSHFDKFEYYEENI